MEGYRSWFFENNRLKSVSHTGFVWHSSTVEATCQHGCEIADCLTNHKCTCGIYSLKSLELLASQYGYMDIIGVIENHGVVVEGELGYRAEKATIRALFTNDFDLGSRLQAVYPDVAIQLIPANIADKLRKQRQSYSSSQSSWEKTQQRAREKEARLQAALGINKILYPGGPKAEEQRLLKLLRGASRAQIQEFAKVYGSSSEWVRRNWLPKAENSRKAKPGDIVFEANDDTKPYVFIGSTRNNKWASTRWLFGRNGLVYRRANIRRWDEDDDLKESRFAAIQEWE